VHGHILLAERVVKNHFVVGRVVNNGERATNFPFAAGDERPRLRSSDLYNS
jgi:hypothetical protein